MVVFFRLALISIGTHVQTQVLKREGFIPRKIHADEANQITGVGVPFRCSAENIPIINYVPVIN
jgi:hypothetical protein